jgi:hypothetical protein
MHKGNTLKNIISHSANRTPDLWSTSPARCRHATRPLIRLCTFLLYYYYHYGGQGGHLNFFKFEMDDVISIGRVQNPLLQRLLLLCTHISFAGRCYRQRFILVGDQFFIFVISKRARSKLMVVGGWAAGRQW